MPKRTAVPLRLLCVAALAVSPVFVSHATQANPADGTYQLDPVSSEVVLTHPDDDSVSVGQVAGDGPSAIQTMRFAGIIICSAK